MSGAIAFFPNFNSTYSVSLWERTLYIVHQVATSRLFDIKNWLLTPTSLNIEKKRKNMAFPIREYWMDVGRLEDFERAREEFV